MPKEFQKPIPVGKLPGDHPDNILTLDIRAVHNLQIGYQAETLYLKKAEDDQLTIREYIGLTGSEYNAKISSNRIKTTIRYGRREIVNLQSCVEIFLPESYHGELQLSTQNGDILTQEQWTFDRFAAETSEGLLSLHSITAPRIHLSTSVSPIEVQYAKGFVDAHSVSGAVSIENIEGGGRLTTSSGPITASFTDLNNIVECETLNAPIRLTLPKNIGMNVDGVSKTGEIFQEIEGLQTRIKPGNIRNVTGRIGEKPYQNIRLNTINGEIHLS